jgi:SAM-dependent methyltransferase
LFDDHVGRRPSRGELLEISPIPYIDVGHRPDLRRIDQPAFGVEQVETADMRKIPFADATFDVVVSCAAIHNLYSAGDRAQAIVEIARVLKPGGQAIIADIRHHREYARTFLEHGCPVVRRVGSRTGLVLWTLVTMGSVRPETLIARKVA